MPLSRFFTLVQKLVEVIQTDRTSDETRDALVELARVMKKSPVNCGDTPGFIVNRLREHLFPSFLSLTMTAV